MGEHYITTFQKYFTESISDSLIEFATVHTTRLNCISCISQNSTIIAFTFIII